MKYVFSAFLLVLLASCSQKSKEESEIDAVDFPVTWQRFDQDFVNTPENQFSTLRAKYPFLLPQNSPDSVWFNKRNDSLFQVVSKEVQSKFTDVQLMEKEVNEVLKRIHYYFPNQQPDKVITLLSDVDVDNRVIYTDSLVLIGLDTYLGKDHRFYSVFPEYTLKDFEAERVATDVAQNFAMQVVPVTKDRTFLGQMIYLGKVMEVTQRMNPSATPAMILNYENEKLEWAKANEVEIWKFFMDSKFLYDTNPKLSMRFLQKAPFSKFYLEFDNESPGAVGIFIGWNIVQSYLKNNNVTLQELLIKDTKEIFDNAKYKPKK